jgi:hypothetical protein
MTSSSNIKKNITVNDAPLPILEQGESVVFRRDNTKGIFHKHITSRDIVTNHRVIHITDYNYSPQIMLRDLEDVLTMNSVSTGNYQYYGTSIGSRYYTRSNYGMGTSQHTTSSDILFIEDGKPKIIFSHVQNAHEVVALSRNPQWVECIDCLKIFDLNLRSLGQVIIADNKFCLACFNSIMEKEYDNDEDSLEFYKKGGAAAVSK